VADTYGALQIPVPTSDTPIGDPLLTTLLAFFQAILNAKASSAWGALDPSKPCVRAVFDSRPEELFNDKQLPALYLARTEVGEAKWIASDWRVRESKLSLSWVFPPVSQNRQSQRDQFINALHSVMETILEFEGRDPSWVVGGDPDPLAATKGSLLWTYAKVHSLRVGKARHVPLIIRYGQPEPGKASAMGVTVAVYGRVEVPIIVEERVLPDLATRYQPHTRLDQTLTDPTPPLPNPVRIDARFT